MSWLVTLASITDSVACNAMSDTSGDFTSRATPHVAIPASVSVVSLTLLILSARSCVDWL